MIRLASIIILFALSLVAQTSNVETVKAWTRTPVMGDPATGELLDPSGMLAPAIRQMAIEESLAASSNLVTAAHTGLTTAMAELLAVTNRISEFDGRIYIAADMDNDEGFLNLWSAVVSESMDTNGVIHYYCHYSRALSTPPKTLWEFDLSESNKIWVPGTVSTNNVTTNVLGYACYDISVQKPAAALNMTIRAHKFLKLGTPTVPFDLSSAGLVLIQGGATNTPYTGTIVTTNAGIITTEVYTSGLMLSLTEVPQ
jgi:hypothetical protein